MIKDIQGEKTLNNINTCDILKFLDKFLIMYSIYLLSSFVSKKQVLSNFDIKIKIMTLI